MATPVYSLSFGAGLLISGGGEVLDLPDGYQWIVRNISGVISSASDGGGGFGASLGAVQFASWFVPSFTSLPFEWAGRIVTTGPSSVNLDILTGSAAGVVVSYAVSGYRLTLP